jgi:hypothetical protein
MTIDSKLLLCLALVLSGVLVYSPCHADGTNNVHSGNIRNADDVQTTVVKIPGLEDRIIFTKQPTQFTVQMNVAEYPLEIPARDYLSGHGKQFADDFAAELAKYQPTKVNELHRQVWLLRADGTVISQWGKPEVTGGANAGWAYDCLIFVFPRKPADVAVGIVVSVNGKLYCQELKNP